MSESTTAGSGPRVDPGALDPAWPDPSGPDPSWPDPSWNDAPEPSGRRRGALIAVVAVVVLALLGGLAWRGGAFGVRTDRRWSVEPGQTITSGPFELTFARLTLQKRQSYSKDLHYEVKVSGTGATNGDESLAPRYTKDSGMFLARDPATGTLAQPENLLIGDTGDSGKTFNPGLPPTAVTVTFDFEASYQPQPTMELAVIEQVLRDNSLLGDQDPEWRNGKHYYAYTFPVTRLPDDIEKA